MARQRGEQRVGLGSDNCRHHPDRLDIGRGGRAAQLGGVDRHSGDVLYRGKLRLAALSISKDSARKIGRSRV